MINDLVPYSCYLRCTKLNTMVGNQLTSQPIVIFVGTDQAGKRNASAVNDWYIKQIQYHVDINKKARESPQLQVFLNLQQINFTKHDLFFYQSTLRDGSLLACCISIEVLLQGLQNQHPCILRARCMGVIKYLQHGCGYHPLLQLLKCSLL